MGRTTTGGDGYGQSAMIAERARLVAHLATAKSHRIREETRVAVAEAHQAIEDARRRLDRIRRGAAAIATADCG